MSYNNSITESLSGPRNIDSLPTDAESDTGDKNLKSLEYDSGVLDLSAKSLPSDNLQESHCIPFHKRHNLFPDKIDILSRLKKETSSSEQRYPWEVPHCHNQYIPYRYSPHSENSCTNMDKIHHSDPSEGALNLVKEETIMEIDTLAVSTENKTESSLNSNLVEVNHTVSPVVNSEFKKESDEREVDDTILINDTIPVENIVTDQVIDVENETYVDLTEDNDDDSDDDITIISVEEPIRYLGSENRPPKRRKRYRRLYDREGNDESQSRATMPGTSSSSRGRAESPLLFRDLLDNNISIEEIREIGSPPSSSVPATGAIAKRMRVLQGQMPSSLEQQVLNDLSDNPHSDEIAQDLRTYEESLRQASRTLYDIQGREFTDTATMSLQPSSSVSLQPSSGHPSSAGLLLKNMFFPTPRLSITANVTMPHMIASEYIPRRSTIASNESAMFSENISRTPTPLDDVLPQEVVVSSSGGYCDYALKSDSIPVLTPSTTSQPSTSAGKLQNVELACPICFEPLSELKKNGRNMCSTICGHMFCKTCLEESFKQSKQCPTCRKKLNKKQYHNIYLNFV